eukprot:3123213-Rhodomonas_salina.2
MAWPPSRSWAPLALALSAPPLARSLSSPLALSLSPPPLSSPLSSSPPSPSLAPPSHSRERKLRCCSGHAHVSAVKPEQCGQTGAVWSNTEQCGQIGTKLRALLYHHTIAAVAR